MSDSPSTETPPPSPPEELQAAHQLLFAMGFQDRNDPDYKFHLTQAVMHLEFRSIASSLSNIDRHLGVLAESQVPEYKADRK